MKFFISILGRFKEYLLAISIFVTFPAVGRQVTVLNDGLIGALSYLSLIGLLWSAILVAAHIRQAWPRWITALLFASSSYFLAVYRGVTTQFMTYDAYLNMVSSSGFLRDALAQNLYAFITALGPSAALLLAMGLAPRRHLPIPDWAQLAAPWAASVFFTAILFLRAAEPIAGSPPSFTPIAYLALASYEEATGDIGARAPVQLPRRTDPLTRNVVFVIDESIAGQYLDINSARGVPTPLSQAWPGIDIHNYGLAASVANCSAPSNVTLRYGGTRKNYQRIIATQASIWAYAHKAGLRTVYIDSQLSGGAMQNLMTPDEYREIDDFIQVGDLPLVQRDIAAAQELVRQLADPRPKFILVNKSGAHFPIQNRYPASYARYRPAIAATPEDNAAYVPKQQGFTGSPAEWRLYRNSYRNALLWNVGGFFDTLLRSGRFEEATLIYTSDHGQNLHEDGSPGLYTHCDPDPKPAEGVVPLVILEGTGASRLDWRRDLAQNRNRSSHYMIFPTLLALMGYDRAAIERHYGRSLDAPSTDPGTYNTLFNARLNRQPIWLSIASARNIQPPALDGMNIGFQDSNH